MPCSLMDVNDLRLVSPECVDLEPEDFDQAVQLSNPVLGETAQWHTYLNGLALQGFIRWIKEQDPSIAIDQQNCSIVKPQYASVLNAVCNLRLENFQVCLVATERLLDEVVAIPAATLDLPDFNAHFYIVVEVQEEQAQIIIRGYSQYDSIGRYRQRVDLSPDDQWNYAVPLSLFDAEPNHLLFQSKFLDAAAIALPDSIAPALTRQWAMSSPVTQAELSSLLSHRHSSQFNFGQVLSWPQGATLLRSSKLLDLFYQWQQSSESSRSLYIRLIEVFTLITQRAINTANWLCTELDDFSQSLGWYSPQMLAAGASGFRSVNRFNVAIDDLKYQGMDIPEQSQPVYKNIELSGELLQVCSMTWALSPLSVAPQWALLVILRTQMGDLLPDRLRLRVTDLTGVSQEEEALDTELLYVRGHASLGKNLVATIISPTGEGLSLTPYGFESGALE
ncbi:MAG: DUF1822 family protein [Cyanobacteria bacterium P01_B01_bin.77]